MMGESKSDSGKANVSEENERLAYPGSVGRFLMP